jgi:polar amino acid transport system substrate-binding protein
MLTEIVGPERDPLLYGDNVDVTAAMQAGQIDAALFDLPTALYLSAVVVEGGAILGQFPADRSENPDQFGLLMEDGNPLKECVDAAITASDRKRTAGRDRGRVASGSHRRSRDRVT